MVIRLRRRNTAVVTAAGFILLLLAAACLGLIDVNPWIPQPHLDDHSNHNRLHQPQKMLTTKEILDTDKDNQKTEDEEEFLNSLPESTSDDIWPSSPSQAFDDRILAQLRYIPRSYNRSNIKIIYVPSGLSHLLPGRLLFTQNRCLVDACTLTAKSKYELTADVRLLRGDAFFDAGYRKPHNQIWVLSLLESPINTPKFSHAEGLVNWTATYRHDSTIVTPYDKYVPLFNLERRESLQHSFGKWPHPPLTATPVEPTRRSHAAGKNRLVAWFVSNCVAANRRYEFVQQLRRHIPVDIYGECGTLGCPRDDQPRCDMTLSRSYKFYLSFENSNCEQYITEKFFHNALWNDVVPVVMGAHKDDYTAAAPPHSFIHVEDFQSTADLANYLLRLNASNRLYDEYFAWKDDHRGRFVDTKFWCRLCALAHDDSGHVSWYEDIDAWWRRPATCTRDRWDRPQDLIQFSTRSADRTR